ncbi:uncharacterized protein UV8b_00652 [Ustilaginoidea virens]|uniref:AoPex11B-like protein n=1 Tax=Ustilaginoidea virens TaxID=1159556 RepID=A0A063BZ21_USTVR|nr:uncharacterized protein UV8b_00652 [Ustilaginoidea virens]QUC16411.1 hypothetical protein UV8b_00652 [Ustilaginoidea virens]GAO13368.1 hypothetical protein UVI_02013780 [Ustilaginoidea virens]
MAGFFEQFVAFGTDIVGLERFMRFIQSVLSILSFYPRLTPLVLLLLLPPTGPARDAKTSELAMRELCSHLNLTRRAIRLFWCLGSFQSSWKAYAAPDKSAEAWLSIMADTLFGLFGMMESVTLPDLLPTAHLSVFGLQEAVRLDGQAQGLWLAALSCAILSSSVRIARAYAHRAVPATGGGLVAEVEDEKRQAGEGDGAAKAAALEKRREEREAAAQEFGGKIKSLTVKLAAEVLDLVIPASTTGLAKFDPGTVSIAMLLSTILTGRIVWERCGRAIDSKPV